jgi:hypothetical protein
MAIGIDRGRPEISCMLFQTAVNTSFNLVLLVGIPLLFYYTVHRRRHERGIAEVMGRAGMRLGESRYLWYAVGGVVVVVLWITVLPPDLEVITREGTVQHRFAGRGIDVSAALPGVACRWISVYS